MCGCMRAQFEAVNVATRNNKTRLIILFGRDEDLVTL